LVRRQNGTYDFIDFREVAPAAAFEDMFVGIIESSLHGGNSRYGIYPLRNAQADTTMRCTRRAARSLADQRYIRTITLEASSAASNQAREIRLPVGPDLVRYMDYGNTSFLVNDPMWSQDFAPNGTRVGVGDYMTSRRYARTLETIAQQGAEAFYTGDVAEATVSATKQAEGIITMDDRAYALKVRTPLNISYRDFKITG
jgi:gamma-glutamyltranspeptidase/glutathione hydrolase